MGGLVIVFLSLNRMPYEVKKVAGGFKVARKTGKPGRPKTFSKAPMSKEMASRQLRALYRSEKAKNKQSY